MEGGGALCHWGEDIGTRSRVHCRFDELLVFKGSVCVNGYCSEPISLTILIYPPFERGRCVSAWCVSA